MLFLWAFLPIVFILDKIAGKSRKLQNLLLLAASLLFYAWGEPRYMWLLLVSILANFALGLFMDAVQGQGRRRTLLIAGILVNLGILGYYKYFNFFINTINKISGRELLSMKDIALPLGVSFFTFQAWITGYGWIFTGAIFPISERSVPFPVKKSWKQWYFPDTGKPC